MLLSLSLSHLQPSFWSWLPYLSWFCILYWLSWNFDTLLQKIKKKTKSLKNLNSPIVLWAMNSTSTTGLLMLRVMQWISVSTDRNKTIHGFNKSWVLMFLERAIQNHPNNTDRFNYIKWFQFAGNFQQLDSNPYQKLIVFLNSK